MDTDTFTLVPCYKSNIIHTHVPDWDKILPMVQSLGSHHTHTTYTRLSFHHTWTTYTQLWLPYIIAIPHIHNFYPTTHLLDLCHTYIITYIKHWLLGTIFWAHIIHIPYTHTFPPSPVTGPSSHMDHIHTTMTPWPSYWACIIHVPPTPPQPLHPTPTPTHCLPRGTSYWVPIIHVPYVHNVYPRHQFLGSHHTYTIYIYFYPRLNYWAYIIHTPHTSCTP